MADDLLTDYTDRITPWHRVRPKFLETVTETLRFLFDGKYFIQTTLAECFDIDEAIGVQLDAVGEWINLSRDVLVPVPDPWFRWGDAKRGWGAGYWKQPIDFEGTLSKLDDETYRRLLKARIHANQWDGTAEDAKEVLKLFFNQGFYTVIVDDKRTMETYYVLSGKWPDHVMLELFRGEYLPLRSAGKRTYHYVNSIDETPVFGWGIDSDKIGGWGSGSWGIDPTAIITAP